MIGTEAMPWDEARNLVLELIKDTSSHVFAALAEWEYPASREAMILADQYDAFVSAYSEAAQQPYPRPSDQRRYVEPMDAERQERIWRTLESMGHKRK